MMIMHMAVRFDCPECMREPRDIALWGGDLSFGLSPWVWKTPFYSDKIPHENSWEILLGWNPPWKFMGDFTRVKSPMKIHGRFYLSKKTPDYKMTHQLFTLFWIISNILTFHFYTFSVIYTFYFYIAFEELTFYQKCSIKCVLYSLFYSLDEGEKLL